MLRQQIHTVRRTVDVSPAVDRQFRRLTDVEVSTVPELIRQAIRRAFGRRPRTTGIPICSRSRKQPRPLATNAAANTHHAGGGGMQRRPHEGGPPVTELPRIETDNPDQALSACRSLLTLVEHIACEQKRGQLEEDSCLSLAPADTWHAIALTTLLVRNTLLHVELHGKPGIAASKRQPQPAPASKLSHTV